MMKQKHILGFTINLLFLAVFSFGYGQENRKVTDSTSIKKAYGIRVGIDLGKIARSFIEDDYTGIQIYGDYRLTKTWYLAAEIGNETKTTKTVYLENIASGNFIKVGLDLNTYNNWLDMDNMVFFGLRFGSALHNQKVENLSVYSKHHYWDDNYSTSNFIDAKDLTAFWAELQFGIKVETFNNLYLGFNAQLKSIINETSADNFENLYIPGFYGTHDSGRFGYGFGYSLSYLIPIYKK